MSGDDATSRVTLISAHHADMLEQRIRNIEQFSSANQLTPRQIRELKARKIHSQ